MTAFFDLATDRHGLPDEGAVCDTL